ncbi:hypothetical protein PGT21_050305 [Puccinia graminis f. sp. tritici]|uniref:Uncharacterized protein n=2 Tax=Puccinia graminis f. sp. tritici TaxID=56615 RepID=E3KPA0_PUCGT|nr:uncharacterized protein PGTG_12081 [Puccinia graminis f. sp. tritici CRL 75-36-700-3]EFP86125.1 hypothetical protein PGTG_12081 [Puccinia graminis f. sp. tritici CRL 75-36-700-3]KAA1074849.1 hypothetical protein PGT21_050305 [Puccinia graminis f. sp. tritici]
MSVSQLDPTLLTLSPLSDRLAPPPPGSQASGPDVTGLTLASDLSNVSGAQSPHLNTTAELAGGKKKRYRRTQKEMAAFRSEQANIKKIKALEKAKEKRAKSRGRGGTRRLTHTSASEQSQANLNQGSAPVTSQPLVPDPNPPFNSDDYENVCSYLEEEANYTRLYGDGSKTSVGKNKVTKGAAYDMFAIFINSSSNLRLRLTGSQLRQRIDGYKKRFMKAKDFAENTGAGIEEGDGLPTLAELLEKKCPCYERMYAIFGAKANVTPLAQFDSGVGANLYADASNVRDGEEPTLSPEVFYSGWEESEVDQPPSGANTPAAGLDLTRCRSAIAHLTSLNIPNSDAEGDLDDDLLPPPLDFSGTAMDPSPSLMTQRSIARATQGSANPAAYSGASVPSVSQLTTRDPGGPSPANGVSTSRRAFANQRSTEASPAGPVREVNGKQKTTLASAFESSNTEKFAYLKAHMEWEKQKEDNRLQWEKERYNKEAQRATEGAQGLAKLAETKLNAAQMWINQGKSSAEVDLLLKAIYG